MTAPPSGAASGGGGGGGGGRGGARGILVPPGEYTVRLSIGGTQLTKKVLVEDDPRVVLTPEDRAVRTKAITELLDLSKESGAAQQRFTGFRSAMTALRESWKRPGAPQIPAAVNAALDDAQKKMDEIEKPPVPDLAVGSSAATYSPAPVSQRVSRLLTAIDGYAMKPDASQIAEISRLRTEVPEVDAKMARLISEELPKLNKAMNDAGIPFITLPAEPTGRGGRRSQ